MQKLITVLEHRFEDINSDVLAATKLAYLPSWPTELDTGGLIRSYDLLMFQVLIDI